MKKLLLVIVTILLCQLSQAQNAPTSTYQGAIVIDKPMPGGIGLKVEGGRTWLHNDDNGAGSEVLELGRNKNWNWPTIRILTSDGGGWNSMRHYATRWGTNFSWSRGSKDGLQLISTFGGADGNQGNYMRIYGIAPDTARVVKIELRSKGNSFINTTGKFGLGTKTPTAKLDVNGDARIRDLPNGGEFVVTADANGNLMRQSYIDFINVIPQPIGDNLGNHEATKTLGMDGNWINGGKGGNAAMDGIFIDSLTHKVGIGIGAPMEKLHVSGKQIIDGDFLKIRDVNNLELSANQSNNNSVVDSDMFPLVINGINNQNVGIGGLPDVRFDVHGKAKIRDLPLAEFPIVTVAPDGVLHQSLFTPFDFLPDHLGNHCAEKDLDMKGFNINNVQDINGFNMNINAVGDLNIHSGDFFYLTAVNGITLDAPKNTNIGIGNAPDADVYLSVNGTTRIKDLPAGYFPVVTADATGKLHQWPIELLDGGGNPGGGCNCDHLQAQIDELRERIEQLENQ